MTVRARRRRAIAPAGQPTNVERALAAGVAAVGLVAVDGERDVVKTRAHTDASLVEERTTTDVANNRTAASVQRVLDDLIERDRIIADEQLSKFRKLADSVLAKERAASPSSNQSVDVERDLADKRKGAERDIMDALLEQTRQRADAIVEKERLELKNDRAGLETRRRNTDGNLSTERGDADVAATALDEAKDALAKAESEQVRRRDVLAMVTHDLRSPLSVIALNAQAIAESSKEVSTCEGAQEIVLATARMDRLLTDLLDVARIESETLRIDKRDHDVRALLKEVFQTYRPLFADRKMTLSVEVPFEAVVASFDHDRIVQVLSNLLGNAMKFTASSGSIALHVETRDQEVEFVLRDTGPGIHPNALPHVFKRFWQTDSDARRGLGLGLYICEKIVEAHGGRIWVESEFGGGATFRFTLPASLKEDHSQAL